MIRYFKLFDLLNRRDMKLSDLRKILSSATVAKLKKGEYISGEALEKICIFLDCQPGDIMEVVKVENTDNDNTKILIKNYIASRELNLVGEKIIIETYKDDMDINSSDIEGFTKRAVVQDDMEGCPREED